MEKRKKIKKVLLIFPPVTFSRESPKQIMPPLGIGYLAAVLRDDYEVCILDAALEGYNQERPERKGFLTYGLSTAQIEARIRGAAPDAVGVSCLYSSQFPQTLAVTEAAKRVDPDIVTVIGGTHPSFLPEECLRHPSIDFIVRGEGETVLPRLFAALNAGTDYSAFPGIAFRDAGGMRINSFSEPAADVDKLPFPERAAFPLEKYFRINLPMGLVYRRAPVINMITSRGCIYNCAFCSSCRFWGNRFRPRSVESVLAEMEYLKRTLGVREIKFFDDNLTCDPRRAKAIFRGMIERGFDFTWNTPNGIDLRTLDEEMIVLMKQSGCYELTLAIESGDESVRKTIINKPLDSETIIRATRLIQRHGIDTYGFFIIGFPGETRRQIGQTFRFIETLRLDRISLFIANPLPGTRLSEICRELGYPAPSGADQCLDYFHACFETKEFSRRYLEKARRDFYWKYNLSLLLRNPFKFFRKYSIFLCVRPLLLWEMLWKKLIAPSVRNADNKS